MLNSHNGLRKLNVNLDKVTLAIVNETVGNYFLRTQPKSVEDFDLKLFFAIHRNIKTQQEAHEIAKRYANAYGLSIVFDQSCGYLKMCMNLLDTSEQENEKALA